MKDGPGVAAHKRQRQMIAANSIGNHTNDAANKKTSSRAP